MKTAVLTILATVVFMGLYAAPGSAAVRDCHTYSDKPNTLISSARNMTCGQAVRVMRGYQGQIYRRFRVARFTCIRQSGGQFGGQWRCSAGGQAFRFEFKD